MNKLLDYHNCFVCGKGSANGLKVDFTVTENGARTSFTPGREFEGFKGVVHGGILCALLDETMWKAVNGRTGAVTVTVKMDVRFKKPARVGTTFLVEANVTGNKRKLHETEAKILDSEGKVIAEATGVFMELDAESAAAMLD